MFNLYNIQKALKEATEEVPETMPLYISSYLKFGEKNRPFAKNTTKNIFDKTGTLYRSFNRRDVNNITNISYKKDGVNIEYGSKVIYASIHETGKFIKSKGNMHKYFFAKYKQTNNESYKWVALSVLKKGGVNIPKRPYFEPALKDFENEGLPLILENLLNKIISSNE